jgi:hypothetical protein
VLESREGAPTSPVKRVPVAHEAREQVGQKRIDGPALFCREDARLTEEVGVDSQRTLVFMQAFAQSTGRTILASHRAWYRRASPSI